MPILGTSSWVTPIITLISLGIYLIIEKKTDFSISLAPNSHFVILNTEYF